MTQPSSASPAGAAPDLPSFPPGFVFGTATASYQIEGAVAEDGRGPSIWDTFCRVPGAIDNGDTGDVACDHYHRWPQDVALMRDLGIGAYRFSVAWPRVLPTGRGEVNKPGLEFYDRLVDALLAAGISPCVTLYHWDLPQRLEDEGGWRVRSTAEAFAEYAAVVHSALGDRVAQWITLNEPFVSAFVGHAEGRHAPGTREGHGALAAAHHLLVGHGLAVQALRAQRRGDEQVGITLNLNDVRPAPGLDVADPDVAAALRRARCHQNQVFTDPLLAGRYPSAETETWPGLTDWSFRRDGDLALVGQPLDFLGVNTYFPSFVAPAAHQDPDPATRTAMDVAVASVVPDDLPTSEMGWPIDPTIMENLMGWLRETYPGLPPIYITENGGAFPDVVGADGTVDDADRIAYLDGHLRSLRRGMDAGTDVRGYFCWSLLDNFEWARGYAKRFGLVHVDYAMQQRTPKASYRWFAALARAHRAPDAR